MISFEVHFDLATKQRRIEEISHLETEESFWQDNKKAKVLSMEKSRMEAELKSFADLEAAYSDAETMFQMAEESRADSPSGLIDESLMAEAGSMMAPLITLFEKAELTKMLSDPNDVRNAIVTINA